MIAQSAGDAGAVECAGMQCGELIANGWEGGEVGNGAAVDLPPARGRPEQELLHFGLTKSALQEADALLIEILDFGQDGSVQNAVPAIVQKLALVDFAFGTSGNHRHDPAGAVDQAVLHNSKIGSGGMVQIMDAELIGDDGVKLDAAGEQSLVLRDIAKEGVECLGTGFNLLFLQRVMNKGAVVLQ